MIVHSSCKRILQLMETSMALCIDMLASTADTSFKRIKF
jgi:hypothetical protein